MVFPGTLVLPSNLSTNNVWPNILDENGLGMFEWVEFLPFSDNTYTLCTYAAWVVILDVLRISTGGKPYTL